MTWYYCNQCKIYFTFHSNFDEVIWSMMRNNCKRCHSPKIISINVENVKSGEKYNIYDYCMECYQIKLVCSGTGCCYKCDHPIKKEKINE